MTKIIMSPLIIKTAHNIGFMAAASHNAFFNPESAYLTADISSAPKESVFPSIRREAKVLLSLYAVISIIVAIFLINRIVSAEYAISSISKNIVKEENLKTARFAEYAAIKSSHTLANIIEKDQTKEFVSVESVKYIATDAIVQANAILK